MGELSFPRVALESIVDGGACFCERGGEGFRWLELDACTISYVHFLGSA